MHPQLAQQITGTVLETATLDPSIIMHALLHSLGMGLVLMSITAWIDAKQLKGASMQSNLQNASNVLFMCVAIATVIILVGNNIARAFALGAAIALIRFKMKLGESSSGSGLLFAILCGMASATGLHSVGWILACGYSLMQILLSLVIQRFPAEVIGAPPAMAPTADSTTGASTTGISTAVEEGVPPVTVSTPVTTLFDRPRTELAPERGKMLKIRSLL